MGSFQIFTKIRGDKLFTGVNDTGDKLTLVSLLTVINDPGDYALFRIFIDGMTPAINLSPVRTTPAINLSLVSTTPAIKVLDEYLSVHTLK